MMRSSVLFLLSSLFFIAICSAAVRDDDGEDERLTRTESVWRRRAAIEGEAARKRIEGAAYDQLISAWDKYVTLQVSKGLSKAGDAPLAEDMAGTFIRTHQGKPLHQFIDSAIAEWKNYIERYRQAQMILATQEEKRQEGSKPQNLRRKTRTSLV